MMYFCPRRLYILANSDDSDYMPPFACLPKNLLTGTHNEQDYKNINPSVPSTSLYLYCSYAPFNIDQRGRGNRDIRDACDLDS